MNQADWHELFEKADWHELFSRAGLTVGLSALACATILTFYFFAR